MGAYATVADMRDQGAAITVSDPRLAEALDAASRTIDRLTGFFFEKRTARTYTLDGDGTPILELPAPCLTLTSVTMDGQSVALGVVRNYNRIPEDADDYWYPRLEWRSGPLRTKRAFGSGRDRAVFWRGEQNIAVVGDFGFVVASVSPTGGLVAPPEIRRATLMLASLAMADLAGPNALQNRLSRFFSSESMGNYSYSRGSGGGGGSGPTGDADIDAILLRYTRSQMSAPGWA